MAASQRARARSGRTDGQSAGQVGGGYVSSRYSMIASESGITTPSWWSTGTLPVGDTLRLWTRFLSSTSCMERSSNATPLCFKATQARIDQDERFFSPM